MVIKVEVWILKRSNFNDKYLSLKLLSYVYRLKRKDKFNPSLIYFNEFGKPYYPDFNYNISHSKNYICIAVSYDSVGIDIEEDRKVSPLIIKKVYHKKEIEDFNNIIDMWTFKEAYSKFIGKGITMDFTKILRSDVEASLVTSNLSGSDYYCYVIGKEEVSKIYFLDSERVVEV